MLALVTAEMSQVYNALVEHKVLVGVFDMFFRYEWNNMLHGVVENMVLTILGNSTFDEDSGDDGDGGESKSMYKTGELYNILKKDAFQAAFLLRHICEAFKKNIKAENEKKGFRLGFMGHLLRICVAICTCCNDDMLSSWGIPKEDILAWKELKEGQLAKDIEEREKVLGGYRPGGVEDDDDEDLINSLQFGDVSLDDQDDTTELYDWDQTEADDQLGDDNSSDDSDDDEPTAVDMEDEIDYVVPDLEI